MCALFVIWSGKQSLSGRGQETDPADDFTCRRASSGGNIQTDRQADDRQRHKVMMDRRPVDRVTPGLSVAERKKGGGRMVNDISRF